jgi:hypothetical protein
VFVHVVDERFKLVDVCKEARTAGASDAINRLWAATVAADAACVDDAQLAKREEMAIQISIGQSARGLQIGERQAFGICN